MRPVMTFTVSVIDLCRVSRLVEGLLGQAISLSLIFMFFLLLSALPRGVTLTTQPHIHEQKKFSLLSPSSPYPQCAHGLPCLQSDG
jgi:hypothetical protein